MILMEIGWRCGESYRTQTDSVGMVPLKLFGVWELAPLFPFANKALTSQHSNSSSISAISRQRLSACLIFSDNEKDLGFAAGHLECRCVAADFVGVADV